MSGTPWDPGAAGVLRLPSGRLVRGRALRRPLPDGLRPQWGLYLLGRRPPPVDWDAYWLRWRDFGLPHDGQEAARVLRQAWERLDTERVEVACGAGRGRTGTALACLAVLDGLEPRAAVAAVRAGYLRSAVETPWQRRWVDRFAEAV